jgi:hypothetical protein
MAGGRSIEQRKADVLATLEAQGDVWLATADAAARPHLIAVSCWWDGARLVLATTGGSRTAANLHENRWVRLAAGTPSDAIVIDAEVANVVPADQAPPELSGGFASAVGWDPREVGPGWVYFSLRPSRIQAYRGYGELEGREVMRGSRWLA